MAKRSQQDSGEERVTAKSRPMMNLVARTPSLVSFFDFSKPGEEKLRKSKIHEKLRKRSDRGDPISASTERKLSTTFTMSNPWKASLQQVIQNLMTTVLGLRPRRTTDRSDLIKLFGEWYEKFDLVTRKFFSREPRSP